MHERTERAVARILFVFCCALPTFLILSAILYRSTPWHQNAVLAKFSQQLGRELGLIVKMQQCQQVAPGKYILHSVKLIDPETESHLGSIRRIDYLQQDDHLGIVLHQPELQSAGLQRTWHLIHDRLISSAQHTVVPIYVTAQDLTIRSKLGALPLAEVTAKITPEENGIRLVASAGHPDKSGEPLIQAELFRDRSDDQPRTELTLSTVGTALPCAAIADHANWVHKLGPDAEFLGTLRCKQTDDAWKIDLSGARIQNMHLSYLTDELAHRVTGTATLELHQFTLLPGQSIDASGIIHASGVRFEAPLAHSLDQLLGLQIDASRWEQNPGGIECRLAAMHFEIADERLQLTGICDRFREGLQPNVILFGAGTALAMTPESSIRSDRVTAVLSPPSRMLNRWNQVLLPTAPRVQLSTAPSASIRGVRPR
ncbi:hypothetical protein SV7mr_08860 [Stieleria bergensis]|uniref:AsmA-like C-terminal domain-containing protein n=1 Tax=Stieleria bergensis TaxID=2528025 RepID=A0A517SQI7_9BACT|nr:hypothetical protein SV7mr_08860 [Planctomycetes bacterium SV_7m_r]